VLAVQVRDSLFPRFDHSAPWWFAWIPGRGEARLESTLIRPRNLLLYKDDATFPDLAATLIYGFAKNHCFNDGNKRVSTIAGGIFLEANGIMWQPNGNDLVNRILAISASTPAEMDSQISGLTNWIQSTVLTGD